MPVSTGGRESSCSTHLISVKDECILDKGLYNEFRKCLSENRPRPTEVCIEMKVVLLRNGA